MIGPQAIAINTDKKKGTIMVLADLIPAITTTKHANTTRLFAVDDRSSIDIVCYIPK